MCGISGILSLDNKPIKFLDERIKLMTKTLVHRGPDQEGIYISKNKCFALSNNRLSIVSPKEIIDLPFTKNNNEFLSFNGEIYNLKKTLKKLYLTERLILEAGGQHTVLLKHMKT